MIYTLTLNPALDRELLVPEIAFGDVLRATETRVDWGGKGFNVARMLMALGTASVAVCFAGGRTGDALCAGLAALGIATVVVPTQNETRTNVVIAEHGYGRYLKVNEPGPAITHDELAKLRQRVTALAQQGDWWVLAGSLPGGVPSTIYATLIADLRAAGARVVLDTSGEALCLGCAAQPTLVKPNSAELAQLAGRPVHTVNDAIDAARMLPGITSVVSLGKDGALLIDNDHGWLCTPPTITERNPVGAGDSLVGGLVWALDQHMPLSEALRWGVACGAATAAQPGTTVGTRAQVAQLLEQTTLQLVATGLGQPTA